MTIIRLIVAILILVFAAFFAGLNLDNKCSVWLFKNFDNVPVFVTIVMSFIAGIVFAIFTILSTRAAKKIKDSKKNQLKEAKAKAAEATAIKASEKDKSKEKKSIFQKKDNSKEEKPCEAAQVQPQENTSDSVKE